MRADRALGLFLLGLLARLVALPATGTYDTGEWKAWKACLVESGLATVYGPHDGKVGKLALRRGQGDLVRGFVNLRVPPSHCRWQGATRVVDYPPGSLIILWVQGRLYDALAPGMPDGPAFNAAVNLPPLLGSLLIAWLLLGRGRHDPALGRERALAFWLNPAVLLAAPVMGYQDPVFGALALATVLALVDRRFVAAAALLAATGLVKPQGALLVPVFAAVLLREAGWRTWLRCALAGTLVTAAVLMPWWSSGHLLACLYGGLRTAGGGLLAPLGLSLWWPAGYAMQWDLAGPWPASRVVSIAAFEQWAGFDTTLVAWPLVLLGTALVVGLVLRSPREDRRVIPLAVLLQVHVYAFLARGVHENHTLLGLFLLPLLLGSWAPARRALGAASSLAAVNLLLAVRYGEHIPTSAWALAWEAPAGVDAAFAAAALGHGALLAALLWWAAPLARALDPAGGRNAPAQG